MQRPGVPPSRGDREEREEKEIIIFSRYLSFQFASAAAATAAVVFSLYGLRAFENGWNVCEKLFSVLAHPYVRTALVNGNLIFFTAKINYGKAKTK